MDEASITKYKIFTKDGYLFETDNIEELDNKIIIIKPKIILLKKENEFIKTNMSKNKNYWIYTGNISYLQINKNKNTKIQYV